MQLVESQAVLEQLGTEYTDIVTQVDKLLARPNILRFTKWQLNGLVDDKHNQLDVVRALYQQNGILVECKLYLCPVHDIELSQKLYCPDCEIKYKLFDCGTRIVYFVERDKLTLTNPALTMEQILLSNAKSLANHRWVLVTTFDDWDALYCDEVLIEKDHNIDLRIFNKFKIKYITIDLSGVDKEDIAYDQYKGEIFDWFPDKITLDYLKVVLSYRENKDKSLQNFGL